MFRFQRVSCIQLYGFIDLQKQNNPGFEVVGQDGYSFKSGSGKWIAHHDPEKYACDNYGKVLEHPRSGETFEATNIAPGYKSEPWTIEEMLDLINPGGKLRLDGDWS